MPIYYVKTSFGCGLRFGKTRQQVENTVKREAGASHFEFVRLATKEDIAWVKSMGGWLPPELNDSKDKRDGHEQLH